MIKGKVISGDFKRVIVRQKSDANIELGELLVAETDNTKILLQVFDLTYGSQLSQQNLELVSGLKLEEENNLELFDSNLRNYTLASLKPMISLNNSSLCKSLPVFFSTVREVTKEDLSFLTQPKNPLLFGKLRSGSKALDLEISLQGDKVLAHHILISGTTGRGKSVLMSNLLWNCIDNDYSGMLVLDPHDEYYGRNKVGLKDHNKQEKVSYYTSNNPPPGTRTLKINIKSIKPQHFNGVLNFSDPQKQALYTYYKHFGNDWIRSIILEREIENKKDFFRKETLVVIKRQLMNVLDLNFANEEFTCKGIFDFNAGESTIKDICSELEQGKTPIIDTSNISSSAELLIGSLVSTEIFRRYKRYKMKGNLNEKPVISIVLEEAPRVLGKEVLEKGSNIYETIAREGRKFKIGLTAITQLPSLIPRKILANMNTKIILGIEMKAERQAVIESAAQDLSDDDRNIASLDKGEAIVSSNFSKFAIPIKIPFFDDIVKEQKQEYKRDFSDLT